MSAWKHYNSWSPYFYQKYRYYVLANAPGLRGDKNDCADLSIGLLIKFASINGLPVTFKDVDYYLYVSKEMCPFSLYRGQMKITMPWYDVDQFTATVRRYIQVKSLNKFNVDDNPRGPEPGDLMLRYISAFGKTVLHHVAVVLQVYPPGMLHPKEQDQTVPSFPGRGIAEQQGWVTEYFWGTGDVDNDMSTKYRTPDLWTHIDLLNSRGDDKRNAELLYYENAAQLGDDGFRFCKYTDIVLESWDFWHGRDFPKIPDPFGARFYQLY